MSGVNRLEYLDKHEVTLESICKVENGILFITNGYVLYAVLLEVLYFGNTLKIKVFSLTYLTCVQRWKCKTENFVLTCLMADVGVLGGDL